VAAFEGNDRVKSTLVQAISEHLRLAKGLKLRFGRRLLPAKRVNSDTNQTQETAMYAKPTCPQPSSLSITVAAGLATFIALGLLTAVAFLFQRDGAPMEQLAAAERACTQHVYVSEREACMRKWLVARAPNVASK
jgi:hypothetical protein